MDIQEILKNIDKMQDDFREEFGGSTSKSDLYYCNSIINYGEFEEMEGVQC